VGKNAGDAHQRACRLGDQLVEMLSRPSISALSC
jgi:hypothetical protein